MKLYDSSQTFRSVVIPKSRHFKVRVIEVAVAIEMRRFKERIALVVRDATDCVRTRQLLSDHVSLSYVQSSGIVLELRTVKRDRV